MPGLCGNLPRSATDKGGTRVRELLWQAAQLDGWSNLSPLKLKPQILDTELVNLPCWVSIFLLLLFFNLSLLFSIPPTWNVYSAILYVGNM